MAVSINSSRGEAAQKVEEVEIDLLLDGLYQLFGLDFRGYERVSLRQRLFDFMLSRDLKTISSLQDCVIHEPAAADALLCLLAIRRTAIFDDAPAFCCLREVTGQLLRSYPDPKVWIAECTSPEEVFSLAILLEEVGVLEKTQIYATCSNLSLLEKAKEGRFDLDRLAEYEGNYHRGGGTSSLSEYWSKDQDEGIFHPRLARKITWAQYNLVTDTSFNEFQIIICRNQLADFGTILRRRVLGVFSDSLVQFGLLHTDIVNELHTVPFSINYKAVFLQHGIYRRT
jgi:chemotaxis protein methyltransferase CheR